MSGRPVTGHHDELDLDDVALDVDEPVGPEANDEDESLDAAAPARTAASAAARRGAAARGARPTRGSTSTKLRAHKVTRWLHVYTSMICLLVVLFFAVTGLTLNHPDWTLFGSGSRSTVQGTLPADWRDGDTIDWLVVAEDLRNNHGVRGSVSDHRADETQGSIAFNGPGYAANAIIDVAAGTYTLNVEQLGLLAVMNDLHKGRDTNSSWKWLIDVSAVFLAVISLTGLVLQFFLRKRRRSALTSAGVGVVLLLVLVYLTTR